MTSFNVSSAKFNRPVGGRSARVRVPSSVAIVACVMLAGVVAACEAASPGTFDVAVPVTRDAASGGAADAADAVSIESASIAEVTAATYRASPRFVHVTSTRYPSVAALGSMIDVWTSATAAAEYARVSPDGVGSGASLPRGALVVREVRDGAGALTAVTAMFKGEEGYNPLLGDWGFIDVKSPGSATVDAGMTAGPMAECFGCHVPRRGDDYLFGVPGAARGPAGADAGARSTAGSVDQAAE
jgi:hypothetical protein